MRFLALILALMLPLSASAQGDDFAPAKAAIDSLKQLPASVSRVQSVIQGTSYGPFEISGSCDYDKQWYCLGMACRTFKWWWKFPNYTWFKDSLAARYNEVSSVSQQFDSRFTPVKTWMLTSLPQFSQQLDKENEIISAAGRVAADPNSSPAAIEQAKSDLLASLNRIENGLQPGVKQLNDGISSLSNFNSQLNQSLQNVNNLRVSLDRVVSADKANMNAKLGEYPCGDGDARAQYNGIENLVTGQFQNVQTAAQSYGVTSNQTDRDVSIILGTVLNFQTRYQGISQALRLAQLSPAGAVQQLRINVVAASWRDFAQYAEKQLQ
jgi:hypothetical protein